MSTSSDEKRRLRLLRRQAYGYAMLGAEPFFEEMEIDLRPAQPAPVSASEGLIETAAGLFMVIRKQEGAPSEDTIRVIDEWLMDYGDWLRLSSISDLYATEPTGNSPLVPADSSGADDVPTASSGGGSPMVGVILAVGIVVFGGALLALLISSAWKILGLAGLWH